MFHSKNSKLSPLSELRRAGNTRNYSGMTFIEALIWVALFTLVILALVASILYFYRTNRYAIEQSNAVTFSQKGIGKMVRVIREAAYSSEGAYPIVSIAANDFIFYADIDNDPLIEKIHYYLSGTDLIEGIVDAAGDPPSYAGAETLSTLSEQVRNIGQVSTFNYYDKDGAEITNYSNKAAVRFVKVNLIVNVDPNRLPNQITLSSSAAMRNLTAR